MSSSAMEGNELSMDPMVANHVFGGPPGAPVMLSPYINLNWVPPRSLTVVLAVDILLVPPNPTDPPNRTHPLPRQVQHGDDRVYGP